MNRDDEGRSGRPAWQLAVALAAGALVLYVGLGREVFYKTDGPDIVRLLDAHVQHGAPLQHPWHVGFLPWLDAFRRALGALGIVPDYVQLGDWFSALGAAVGIGFCYVGLRRLLPRAVADLAALAVLLNPGTLLFATVVEYHGPLLLPLGLCFWWTAVQVGRPVWWGMALLGVLLHAAFLVHGQAMFHAVWLLGFFVARRWPAGAIRRDLGLAAVAGAVHALLWFAMPRLWPEAYGMWADLATGLATEASIGRPQSLDHTPEILWQEWLWPLLPVSVFVFAAVRQRALRAEFAAFALGLLPFLYVSVRQLVHEPEYGAYLLPMVLPAAMLCAQTFRWFRQAWLALLLGALPIAIDHRAHFAAKRAFDAAFGAGVAAAAQGASPFVLVGSHRELAAAYAVLRPPARRRDPLTEEVLLWVRPNATLPRARLDPTQFAAIEAYLRALHAAGRAVLLTESALRSLDDPAAAMLAEKPTLSVPANDTMAGPLLAAHLRQRFELLPAAPGMLRLRPKP